MANWVKRVMDTFSNLLPFSVPVDRHLDFLGEMYSSPNGLEDPDGMKQVNNAFIEDFRTRVWITYRRDFSSLVDRENHTVGIYTDAGWGCSIRVTQMLLVQAFLGLNFSRSWRYNEAASHDEILLYKKILSLVIDIPSAPVSIHEIVRVGHKLFNKKPGEWFGPTTGAKAVASLFKQLPVADRLGSTVVCFDSGELITTEVVTALNESPNGVIVFVTHRLGLDNFNESRYKQTIQKLFSFPLFQGLSSGEALVSAYYMFACCDEYLYYLDPHTVQPAFDDIEKIHELLPPQPKPLKMRWSRLNPSMNMGFAIKSSDDLNALCSFLKQVDPDLFEIRDVSYKSDSNCCLSNDFGDLAQLSCDVDSEDEDIVLVN